MHGGEQNLPYEIHIWQTVYIVALVFLSLVPVIGWITPLIALFVECFYYGFSMMDYSSGELNCLHLLQLNLSIVIKDLPLVTDFYFTSCMD